MRRTDQGRDDAPTRAGRTGQRARLLACSTGLVVLPLVALALAYNWARWGSVARTGYEPYLDVYFGGSLADGAWGMLLSPNKSAFLYSPPLVLAAIGLPAAVRARPRLGLALAAMVAPVFLLYCTYRSWSGDYAWGPRFFVWATPVVLIPIAWCLEAATTRWRRAAVGAVVVAGIAVQVLGNALYWDHFIRVAIDAKNQWLGQPDRSGAYIAARGRGHCDSCFEDTYEILWTPPFQPIRGHAWLLRALARGDDAASAQRDAPWRTYTTLPLQLGAIAEVVAHAAVRVGEAVELVLAVVPARAKLAPGPFGQPARECAMRLVEERPVEMVQLTHVIYALHACAVFVGVTSAVATVAGGFVFGLPSLIAVFLNYLKRGDVAGTWLESHFRWQIRTFWFTLLWLFVAALVMLTIIGIPIAAWVMIPILGLWVGYRVVRGWLALAEIGRAHV